MRRPPGLAFIVSLIVGFGVLGVAGWSPRAHAAGPARITVLYFDNNTGDKAYDPLAKGLADMMITDLSAAPGLVVVEREKLEAVLNELKLQRTKFFDPKTAQKIGKGIGASYAVTGAFVSLEPNIRIDVRVIKIETATVVKASSVDGKKDDFFALWQKLSEKLVEGLGTELPGADADKAREAARANKVDRLGTVLEYAQGLDARDRGDLDGASRHMQKVVSASPDFKLGKDRYRQIMKELYDAKNRREDLLGDSEKRLLADMQRALKGSARERLSYRVLAGQYHLSRVATAVNEGKPPQAYRDDVRGFVDSELLLFDETRDMAEYPTGQNAVSSEDQKLGEEIGIKSPGSTFGIFSPSGVLRELNEFLMANDPSIHRVSLEKDKAPCFFTLDARYPKVVTDAYEKALQHIDKHESRYRDRETMRTLKEYARALAQLGRPEEAIAKLQSGLDRFPKSDEFKGNEELLRSILAGEKIHRWCKQP